MDGCGNVGVANSAHQLIAANAAAGNDGGGADLRVVVAIQDEVTDVQLLRFGCKREENKKNNNAQWKSNIPIDLLGEVSSHNKHLEF